MATTQSITTAEQLLHAPDLGRCELVRGALVMMTPAGFEHGRVGNLLAALLTDFVRRRGLGVVTGPDTGFLLERNPDTVRAPDVAFVEKSRLPAKKITSFFPGAPDLAVEVLSPDDRASEVLAKVQAYLAAGCKVVWVVDPETQIVSAHDSAGRVVKWTGTAAISGEPLLPGFELPLADLFGE